MCSAAEHHKLTRYERLTPPTNMPHELLVYITEGRTHTHTRRHDAGTEATGVVMYIVQKASA